MKAARPSRRILPFLRRPVLAAVLGGLAATPAAASWAEDTAGPSAKEGSSAPLETRKNRDAVFDLLEAQDRLAAARRLTSLNLFITPALAERLVSDAREALARTAQPPDGTDPVSAQLSDMARVDSEKKSEALAVLQGLIKRGVTRGVKLVADAQQEVRKLDLLAADFNKGRSLKALLVARYLEDFTTRNPKVGCSEAISSFGTVFVGNRGPEAKSVDGLVKSLLGAEKARESVRVSLEMIKFVKDGLALQAAVEDPKKWAQGKLQEFATEVLENRGYDKETAQKAVGLIDTARKNVAAAWEQWEKISESQDVMMPATVKSAGKGFAVMGAVFKTATSAVRATGVGEAISPVLDILDSYADAFGLVWEYGQAMSRLTGKVEQDFPGVYGAEVWRRMGSDHGIGEVQKDETAARLGLRIGYLSRLDSKCFFGLDENAYETESRLVCDRAVAALQDERIVNVSYDAAEGWGSWLGRVGHSVSPLSLFEHIAGPGGSGEAEAASFEERVKKAARHGALQAKDLLALGRGQAVEVAIGGKVRSLTFEQLEELRDEALDRWGAEEFLRQSLKAPKPEHKELYFDFRRAISASGLALTRESYLRLFRNFTDTGGDLAVLIKRLRKARDERLYGSLSLGIPRLEPQPGGSVRVSVVTDGLLPGAVLDAELKVTAAGRDSVQQALRLSNGVQIVTVSLGGGKPARALEALVTVALPGGKVVSARREASLPAACSPGVYKKSGPGEAPDQDQECLDEEGDAAEPERREGSPGGTTPDDSAAIASCVSQLASLPKGCQASDIIENARFKATTCGDKGWVNFGAARPGSRMWGEMHVVDIDKDCQGRLIDCEKEKRFPCKDQASQAGGGAGGKPQGAGNGPGDLKGPLQLERVEGAVSFYFKDRSEAKPLRPGDELKPGMILETGKDGKVVIVTPNKTKVTMGPDTRMQPSSLRDGRQSMFVLAGGVEVERETGAPGYDDVVVESVDGSIQGSGTRYAVRVGERGTAFEVSEGSARLTGERLVRGASSAEEGRGGALVQELRLSAGDRAFAYHAADGPRPADERVIRDGRPATDDMSGTGGGGRAAGGDKDGGSPLSRPDPWNDPQVQAFIDEWLRTATPMSAATRPGTWRFTEWGQVLGPGSRATGAPDHPAGWSRHQSLWPMRSRFDSLNLCTMGEFVERRLSNKSLEDCAKPTAAGPESAPAKEEVVSSLTNGSFSRGRDGFRTGYAFTTSPRGLYNAGTCAVGSDPAFYHPAFTGRDHTTGRGDFLMVNAAVEPDVPVWSQTIATNRNGGRRKFGAWVISLTSGNPARLRVEINGETAGNWTAPKTAGIWEHYSLSWDAGETETARVTIFEDGRGSTGGDFGLDDLSFENEGLEQ